MNNQSSNYYTVFHGVWETGEISFRDYGKAKKKICVFTVTRPTLIFASDPMHFYTEFG